MAADWSSDVVNAVERWIATKPGQSGSRRWRSIGFAVPHSDDGWLVLDLRSTRTGGDSLDDLCFASGRGPDDGPSHPVEEFRSADDVLMLREPPGLPDRCRHVWVRVVSPRFLLEKLRDGLRAAGDAPLAQALANRRLSGPPTVRLAVDGLLDAQAEAFRACLSPGVRMVWGPPGTGKTQVLARAIEELVRAGKRVLLVSTANVAVDNALLAALPRLPRLPGVAIRVGPAHLKEIATNPDVQLERRAATASRQVDAKRERLAARLREIDELDAEIEGLRAALRDYDDRAYREAASRIAAEQRLAVLNERIREAEQVAQVTAIGVAAARKTLEAAESTHRGLDRQRRAFSADRAAAQELARLDAEERTRRLELEALALEPEPSGWLAHRRYRKRRDDAAAELRSFTEQTEPRRQKPRAIRDEAREIIGTTTQADVDNADRRLASARAALTDREREQSQARQALDELYGAATEARSWGTPSAEDRQRVAVCDVCELPARFARFQELLRRQQQRAGQRGRLEEEHRQLVDEARRLRTDAEKAIVDAAQVVATTLARSRVHRAISSATFDVVLVDEAGAAALAEVLLALCRGTRTAVLFGDFLQLGPVLEGLERNPDPGIATWIRATCFSHVGIRSPSDVEPGGSCIALNHQFRFGPQLRRLANDVIYDVLRDAADLPTVAINPRTEIVLVNVATVPELAVIRAGSRSGRWWTAGVVVSRALAQLHLPEGAVGVVTPYRAQSDATLAALQDQRIVAGVAAGTVHSFQGREYPAVVFDLVDDGSGWVAQGRRDRGSFEETGLKTFGVGITRARDRLYLLVDGTAVRTAGAGPLRELRRALERGDVQEWSAAALLGMAEAPPGPVESAFAEATQFLQQLVSVTDIHDERTFVAELERHLGAARQSIWMWSPWVANRAAQVIPSIRAAVQRGVDVRVFIRPDTDRNMATPAAQRRLPDLFGSGATIIRSDHEHRKIVVIDRQTVLLGSVNALSNTPGTTRETMITMSGQAFAGRLLTELRAQELGKPRPCTGCGETMEVRRSGGKAAELFWQCRPCRVRVPPRSTSRR
jgi:hypothetical protein